MIFEAHRGVANEYPENTLPAFEAAHKLGYKMIECDTKFTADDRCIFLHDRSCYRTARTSDGGRVPDTPANELTFDEIRSWDFGLWMGERFRGTLAPTLEEVLEFVARTEVPLKLDNVFMSFKPEQREIMYRIIERSGTEEYMGFTCKSLDQVEYHTTRFPKCTIHYEYHVDAPFDESVIARAAELSKGHRFTVFIPMDIKATAWFKGPHATPENCAIAKKYGELGLWILRTEDELRQAKELGADIVETDGSLRP
ncbi:MAG: hypothetical protein GX628_03030 [Clostridiales bacterium]|nr:hypothetical protein [Clostridiales bacterium]